MLNSPFNNLFFPRVHSCVLELCAEKKSLRTWQATVYENQLAVAVGVILANFPRPVAVFSLCELTANLPLTDIAEHRRDVIFFSGLSSKLVCSCQKCADWLDGDVTAQTKLNVVQAGEVYSFDSVFT